MVDEADPTPVTSMAVQLRAIANMVINTVLPHRCVQCGVMVESDGGFCPTCWQGLDFLGDPSCAICHVPFELAVDAGTICGGCMTDPPPFARAIAPLAYGMGTRDMIIRLKYGRRTGHARVMARMMQLQARQLLDGESDAAPLLIPVPLHRWRLWWRGFNQAALISQHLSRLVDVPVDVHALVRRKATASMRGLGRKARARVVQGAFATTDRGQSVVTGKHILLIDDVFTTGATASACARALKRSGAARVSVLSFARVVDGRGRPPIDIAVPPSDMLGHGQD